MAGNRPLVIVLAGDITRGDIDTLCQRAHAEIERSPSDAVVCDVGGVKVADVAVVDALSRLNLTTRRLRRRLAIRGACEDLRELIALMGLTEVLPSLRVEPRRETEQREEAPGVEEERDPGDHAV